MFHFIGFLIFGLIVGLIARAVTPGQQHMSLGKTTILGIVGALLAGWLGRAAGWYGPDDGSGFISATIGAVVVLAIYHMIARNRGGTLSSVSSKRDFPRKVA